MILHFNTFNSGFHSQSGLGRHVDGHLAQAPADTGSPSWVKLAGGCSQSDPRFVDASNLGLFSKKGSDVLKGHAHKFICYLDFPL